MNLNLGCGFDNKKDFLNVDKIKTPAANIIADINYLPFKPDSFDEVYLSHVLEHITDTNKILKSVHKISKKDAKIIIRVPHSFTHSNFRLDKTEVNTSSPE